MTTLVAARACADCGEVIDREHLAIVGGPRLLCLACRRDDADRVKRDAEVWLEQMVTRTRA